MNVKLIATTQAVDAETGKNAEELIAYIARVSNPSNQNNKLTSEKLINYCITHKHWSVFEHFFVTLEIETTRDIARQILRHRSFCFQEFSQRYSDPTKTLGFVIRESRLQDSKNRQNSIETDDIDLHTNWENIQNEVIAVTSDAYSWAIRNNIAKEQARCVLPEGLISSRMYMSGNIRNWIHYIQVRSSIETQKEHREIAIACVEAIKPIFPSIVDFLS